MQELTSPIQCLQEAIDTFIQRGKVYDGEAGQAYRMFGPIMMAFFPNGITISSSEEWNRYALFHMEVAKLARYASNFKVGHIDSQHDVIVYASMLESLDREIAERKDKDAHE